MKKPTVVILGDCLTEQNAGIYYYGLQFLEGLYSNYPDFNFVLFTTSSFQYKNLKNIIVPIKKWIPMHLRFRQLFVLPKLVRKLEPDCVIELAHFGPFGIPKKIPQITIIHDITPITYPSFHGWLSQWMHKFLLPRVFRKVDQIVVNSNTTKNDILQYFKIEEDKVKVCYPTISENYNADVNLESKPYFISIGTIEPRKNYLCVINGFNAYCENGGKHDLVIVGLEGWGMEAFGKAFVNSKFKDRISIRNNIERVELWKLLKNASGLISASHYEGFGLPVLEAMSLDIPLVLSDIPVYKEIAEDAALFFSPNDPAVLGNMLLTCESETELYSERSKAQYSKYVNEIDFNIPILDKLSP